MKDVAVDACCLINLLAAGSILPRPTIHEKQSKGRFASHEIPSLGLSLHVPDAVANESLYLLQPDDDDPTNLSKTPIDLQPYFDHGVLNKCEMSGDDELALFVGYATRLDDGEAACLAISRNRGWTLATDDRPATTLALRQNISVMTTAELVKRWTTRTKATKKVISAILSNIERFARFIPRPSSPEASWWLSHTEI